jgi:hypothetical protein
MHRMGGRPVLALTWWFPIKTMSASVLEAILRGGEAKLAEPALR